MSIKWTVTKSHSEFSAATKCRPYDYPATSGEYHRTVVNHGVKDAKGREVGTDAQIDTAALRYEGSIEAGTCKMVPAISLTMGATRDGKGFGAYVSPTYHATLAEAMAVAEKKIAAKQRKIEREAAKAGGTYLTASQKRKVS